MGQSVSSVQMSRIGLSDAIGGQPFPNQLSVLQLGRPAAKDPCRLQRYLMDFSVCVDGCHPDDLFFSSDSLLSHLPNSYTQQSFLVYFNTFAFITFHHLHARC